MLLLQNIMRRFDKLRLMLMFPSEDLKAIGDAVKHAEEYTSGEIRVVIRMRLDPDITSVKDQAEREFIKHDLQNTRDRTGILILIVVAERQFYIFGDMGINNKLPNSFWEEQALSMSELFKQERYVEGIRQIIRVIGGHLASHFPPREDDTDELPNRPALEV